MINEFVDKFKTLSFLLERETEHIVKMEAKAGDRVDIRTVHGNQQGVLIESSEPGIVLLKLSSGYNIGIKKEDIVEISVLESRKEEKQRETKIKINPKLPSVDIIMTGGTISSRIDYKTGAVSALTKPEQLFEMYPELLEICNVRKIETPFMKLSENMDSLDWKEIAKIAEKSLNDSACDGVIVTHGTDTLHYTSAALSFFLRDLNKPVVLTYAQRSSDRASSDAAMNLKCAALSAVSDIAEVMIVGHGTWNDDFCYALRGSKVRKMHTSRRDAFKSINTKQIAKIFPDGRVERISNYNLRDNARKTRIDASFNDRVALVKFYPGMNPEILDYYSGRYQGIVLEMTGLGHVSVQDSRNNWIPAIKKAIDNGLIVCGACQTIYGSLNPKVYSSGRELEKIGVIFLGDMLAETAFVKLGWVLGHSNWNKNKETIREKMLENISGELNNRLEE